LIVLGPSDGHRLISFSGTLQFGAFSLLHGFDGKLFREFGRNYLMRLS
jgi:hypothetical protein